MPRRIFAAPPPERGRGAKPGGRDRRIRGHAAADREMIEAPDLLAATRQEMVDPPNLVERGQTQADHADATGACCKISQRNRLTENFALAHVRTWPLLLSNRCVLPGVGRKPRRSPTFGRSAGSTRAIAEAPARSK